MNNSNEHNYRLEQRMDKEGFFKKIRKNLSEVDEDLEESRDKLQEANEKLKAANEELLLANERLAVSNEDNRKKIARLEELTDDMENLLRSTQIGTIFLDMDLTIRKFTPAVTHILNLNESDTGRSIEDFAGEFSGSHSFIDEIRHVIQTGGIKVREVHDERGRWFLQRILPFKNEKDDICGCVLSYVDISERKDLEHQLEQSRHRLEEKVAEKTSDMDELIKELNCIYQAVRDLSDTDKDLEQSGKTILRSIVGLFSDSEEYGARILIDGKTWSSKYFDADKVVHRTGIKTQRGMEGTIEVTGKQLPVSEKENLIHTIAEEFARFIDRKRAETALKNSEERLRRAVVDSPFPTMIHAEDGQVLLLSKVWTRITGYDHEEIPTIDAWTKKAFGNRGQKVRSIIEKIFEADKAVRQGEYQVRTKKDGERIWDFSSAPLGQLEDGRRILMSKAADITDLKHTEQKLRHRTEELQKSNRELKRSRAEAMRNLEEANRHRERAELALVELEKSRKNLRMRARWAEGLQRAGEELAKCTTTDQVAQLAATAPVKYLGLTAGWVCTPDSRGKPVLLAISDPELKNSLIEYPCTEKVFQGQEKPSVHDFFHQTPSGKCHDKAKKMGFQFCATFPIKTGETFIATLSVRGGALGNKETVQYAQHLLEIFCAQVGEVWVRCRKEKEISRARDLAEKANQSKSEFLANMSHELRTPLNAIIGFSEVLVDQNFGPLNEKQKKYTNNILTSGRHLLLLINEILDLSKVESGKMKLEPAWQKMKEAIQSSLTMVREKAVKHGIKLTAEVDSFFEKNEIWADDRKIKQILYNLVSNAVKFTDRGGKVSVSVNRPEKQRAGDSSPTGKDENSGQEIVMEISVRDTGIGIDPRDQERIFKAFEQVDSSYSKKHEGTGLGLALTKKLVRLHDGRLWVESEGNGKGSTFTLAVPVKTRSLEMQETKPRKPDMKKAREKGKPCGKGHLVMVVEDDDAAFELIHNYLEKNAYRTTRATTATEAIELAQSAKPEVIILDIYLPDGDGLTVLEKLKADPGTQKIPVIITSVSDRMESGLSKGAIAWFVKPLGQDKIEKLFETISSSLRLNDPAVLLIDDDSMVAESLKDLFDSENYRVKYAQNGSQGIELALEEKPDLIVMDLMMPDMPGLEVARKLFQEPKTASIPIIIYTSAEIGEIDKGSFQENVRGISPKSLGPRMLLGQVQKVRQSPK